MIQYRPFWNRDSPGLVAVWNSQATLRGRVAPLTCALLEQFVLSKPFFDPEGLIVATEGPRVVGFAHGGFLPSGQAGELEHGTGVICQLLVEPRSAPEWIARELLRRCEVYLRDRGAKECTAGAVGWRGPFYFGVYGGSQLPGVLDGDTVWTEALRDAGYAARGRRIILQRRLADFRPPIDRPMMQLRRQYRLLHVAESQAAGWDEACAWCWIDRDEFVVVPISGGSNLGSLTFWNMEPFGAMWGARAMGLLESRYEASPAHPDVLPCFLGEALRHFQPQGVDLVEVQVAETDVPLREACRRLGFQELDHGTTYAESAGESA